MWLDWVRVCLIECDWGWVEDVVDVLNCIIVLNGDGLLVEFLEEVVVLCVDVVLVIIDDDKINIFVVVWVK